MKRRLFSIAAALLLLVCLQPLAHADMTYAAPEDVAVGSELDHLVATVPADSRVSASNGTLPEGIALDIEEISNGQHMANVYLRGKPREVGEYSCVVNISSDESSSLIIVPLSVVPETPVVTAGAAVNCFVNDTAQVSVTASVVSGSLSYQWYSNTVSSIAGSSPIAGANQPVYTVNTSTAGTMYYYCTVTNTVDGQTKSVTSGIIPVTVGELSVTSISVETLPSRTVYTAGDRLDPTGLSIRVNHSNGSSRVVSDTGSFGFYPTQLNTAGNQNIEVSYQGLTCIFQVTVEPAAEVIQGIGVLTMPNKRTYTVGDTLDTAGLSIRVYSNNGQRDVTEGFTCSPMVFDRAGTQTVTVSYGGMTCTFTLEVEEEEKPTGIIVSTMPTKLNYNVGDPLDIAGLTLRLITNKNNAQDIYTGFMCTPSVLQTAGRQEITVIYETFTCTFNVNVTAPVQTTPPVESTTQPFTPVPTIQPTATPVATPHIIEHQSHSTGANIALIVVIVIAAILGLGGLGAYVFIMNRGGLEAISADLGALFGRKKTPAAPVRKPVAPENRQPAPVSKPTAPANEPPAPVSKPAAPADEPPAPVSKPAVPADEPPAPVGKHEAPAREAQTSVGKHMAPEEPAAPKSEWELPKEKFYDLEDFK